MPEKDSAITWKQDFQRIWLGQLVSQFGSAGFAAATTLWLAYQTNSGAWVSIALVVPQLVQLAVGIHSGALVDTVSRRTLFVVCDLIRAGCVALLAFYLFSFPVVNVWTLLALLTCSTILAVTSSVFYPAYEAILYDLVPEDCRVRYRSKLSVSQSLTRILGPNIGATLLSVTGPVITLLVDSVSYVYAALSTLRTGFEKSQRHSDKTRTNVHQRAIEGLQYIVSNVRLKRLICLAVAINFFTFPIGMLNAFLVKNTFHLPMQWSAILQSAGAIGALASGVFLDRWKHSDARRSGLLYWGLAIASLSLLVISWSAQFWVALAAYGAFQAASVPINLVLMTRIQQEASSERIGRVFSAVMILSNLSSPFSTMLAGQALGFLASDPRLIYLTMGIGVGFIACTAGRLKDKVPAEASHVAGDRSKR